MEDNKTNFQPGVQDVKLIDEATKQEILARYEILELNEVAIYKLCCIIHTLEQYLKEK